MRRLKKLKNYTLYTLLVTFLFCGCSEPNVNVKSTDYILNGLGSRIKVIEVDNCEYLFYESGYQMAIAHKGNCKYCTKRANK